MWKDFLRFPPQDNEKISALHEEREKKVQELEVNIDRMRNQQDQLHKKLKEEADRKIKMERDMQKQQQKIKELEDHMSQQQKVLKRKTEEVAAAQRRLRNVGKQGSEEKEKYDKSLPLLLHCSSLPTCHPPSPRTSLMPCLPPGLTSLPPCLFLSLSTSLLACIPPYLTSLSFTLFPCLPLYLTYFPSFLPASLPPSLSFDSLLFFLSLQNIFLLCCLPFLTPRFLPASLSPCLFLILPPSLPRSLPLSLAPSLRPSVLPCLPFFFLPSLLFSN